MRNGNTKITKKEILCKKNCIKILLLILQQKKGTSNETYAL